MSLHREDLPEPGRGEWLDWLTRFHGHLGPYAVVGFRMGELANDKLTPDAFGKRALVKTGTEPSISCIIDGIQLSSCCTLGKGRIEVSNEKVPEAIFTSKEKSLLVRLKDDIWDEIKAGISREENNGYCRRLFEMPLDEMLDYREMD